VIYDPLLSRPMAVDGTVTVDPRDRTLTVRPAPDARPLAKHLGTKGSAPKPKHPDTVGRRPCGPAVAGRTRSPTACRRQAVTRSSSGSIPAIRCTRGWSRRQVCARSSS
jgi:hypothetical protein